MPPLACVIHVTSGTRKWKAPEQDCAQVYVAGIALSIENQERKSVKYGVDRNERNMPENDQRQNQRAAPKMCKGFGAVTPINQPEDWQAVRREFEELVAASAYEEMLVQSVEECGVLLKRKE